ncbi:hypothetical protein ANO11243_092880 [Dothideomycetidae sp. 11243]|nr:hypothetical protein ANO11243_092880 [fungal sp. No.11243]
MKFLGLSVLVAAFAVQTRAAINVYREWTAPHCRGQTASDAAFLTVQFRLAAFTSQSFEGEDNVGIPPTESLSLQYGASVISFTPSRADGTPADPIVSGWSSVNDGPVG